jgi:hypothetical protein
MDTKLRLFAVQLQVEYESKDIPIPEREDLYVVAQTEKEAEEKTKAHYRFHAKWKGDVRSSVVGYEILNIFPMDTKPPALVDPLLRYIYEGKVI